MCFGLIVISFIHIYTYLFYVFKYSDVKKFPTLTKKNSSQTAGGYGNGYRNLLTILAISRIEFGS